MFTKEDLDRLKGINTTSKNEKQYNFADIKERPHDLRIGDIVLGANGKDIREAGGITITSGYGIKKGSLVNITVDSFDGKEHITLSMDDIKELTKLR